MIAMDKRGYTKQSAIVFCDVLMAPLRAFAESKSLSLSSRLVSMNKLLVNGLVIVFLGFHSSGVLAEWDEECVIPQDTMMQSIIIVSYGVARERNTPWAQNLTWEGDVFLVCGGSYRDTLEPICEIPIQGATKIAIFANEYNNVVKPKLGNACGEYVWRESAIRAQPWWMRKPPAKLRTWISELYVIGNGGDDLISGMQDATTRNIIFGDYMARYQRTLRPGFDVLQGGPGNDAIYGEGLDDVIFGYGGNDYLVGGSVSGCAEDTIHDEDLIFGGQGDDVIFGDGVTGDCDGTPVAYCGSGKNPSNDAASDESYGWYDDNLVGGGGADIIVAGAGDDILGGDYTPPVPPGSPKDILCGGPGRDWFYADAPDVVYYEPEGDVLTCERDGEPRNNCFLYPEFREEPATIECAWDDLCPTEWLGPAGQSDPSHY